MSKARAAEAVLAVLAVLAFLTAGPGPAASADPAPTSEAREARARAVLETQCARCHEHGRLDKAEPEGHVGHILDLATIATDPGLVRPGFADASPLYTTLLTRHLPLDVLAGPEPGRLPSPIDIEAVRDWIEGLDTGLGTCPSRVPVTRAEIALVTSGWRQEMPEGERPQWRFLSFAHLYNACAGEAELARYRQAAQSLVTAGTSGTAETIGDKNLVIAFRRDRAGWPAEMVDAFAKACTEVAPGTIAADCLAAELAQGRPGDTAPAAAATAGNRIFGLLPLQGLARLHRRPVTLERAAAELGLTAEALTSRLAADGSEMGRLGRRLVQSGLARQDWQRLAAGLAAGSAGLPPAPAVPSPEGPVSIALTSEKRLYRKGDLLSLEVEVDAPCQLTLVHVDPKGEATVVFPNDFEPDNSVGPGGVIRIPAGNASYQLRLDDSGTDSVVAICQRIARRPLGIGHDFELQRFTTLGQWRDQIRDATVREAEWKARMEEMEKFRSRERRRAEREMRVIEAKEAPPGPEYEARTAIRMRVE